MTTETNTCARVRTTARTVSPTAGACHGSVDASRALMAVSSVLNRVRCSRPTAMRSDPADGQTKAENPVIARPTMRLFIWRVPSKV
jgi:hypothetical protein